MVRVFSARVEPTMVFRAEKLPETSNPEACPARLRKHRMVSRKTCCFCVDVVGCKRVPRNPCTLPKSCHKPAKRLPKVSRQAAKSLPKCFKTTSQILLASSVKTGAGSRLIPDGRKSLWHYVFHCFFTFRGPVLRPRFGIYRGTFGTPFWASRGVPG